MKNTDFVLKIAKKKSKQTNNKRSDKRNTQITLITQTIKIKKQKQKNS